jgi:lipopolysaccharide transport system ATP-binding protein
VAAHLNPEILIVDEVLAVGDASFQKKCLGKMKDVAGGGRTVLFVSHNMSAISALCTRAMLSSSGRIVADGSVNDVVTKYNADMLSPHDNRDLIACEDRRGTGRARFSTVDVDFLGPDGNAVSCAFCGCSLNIEATIESSVDIVDANVAVIVYDSHLYRLIDANTALDGKFLTLRRDQTAKVSFTLHDVRLKPGEYVIGLWLGHQNVEEYDDVPQAASVRFCEPPASCHVEVFPGPYQCRFKTGIAIQQARRIH